MRTTIQEDIHKTKVTVPRLGNKVSGAVMMCGVDIRKVLRYQ